MLFQEDLLALPLEKKKKCYKILDVKIYFYLWFKVVKTGRPWYSGQMTRFRIRSPVQNHTLLSIISGRHELCNIRVMTNVGITGKTETGQQLPTIELVRKVSCWSLTSFIRKSSRGYYRGVSQHLVRLTTNIRIPSTRPPAITAHAQEVPKRVPKMTFP